MRRYYKNEGISTGKDILIIDDGYYDFYNYYKTYRELKNAPVHCQIFGNDVNDFMIRHEYYEIFQEHQSKILQKLLSNKGASSE